MIARALLALTLALAPAPAPASAAARPDPLAAVEALMASHPEIVAWQVARGDAGASSAGDVLLERVGPVAELQPWASVTKQVVATMVLQQVAAGRLALDAPASRYVADLTGSERMPTIRELLQHRSGLWNPDDSPPGPRGMPEWYSRRDDPLAACRTGRTAPGGNWRYNNCDYLLLGRIVERVSGKPLAALFRAEIATPAGLRTARFAGSRRPAAVATANSWDDEDDRLFARFGSAGGLTGSVADLARFDRALMTGKLLPAAQRAELWEGDPKLGFMALGQWAFTASLKGCAAPVRIIERRGGIGRYQVRNLILPDQDATVILFVRDADFDFGEIWQGKGLSYDALSAAVCA